jgi:hypothetical protein
MGAASGRYDPVLGRREGLFGMAPIRLPGFRCGRRWLDPAARSAEGGEPLCPNRGAEGLGGQHLHLFPVAQVPPGRLRTNGHLQGEDHPHTRGENAARQAVVFQSRPPARGATASAAACGLSYRSSGLRFPRAAASSPLSWRPKAIL